MPKLDTAPADDRQPSPPPGKRRKQDDCATALTTSTSPLKHRSTTTATTQFVRKTQQRHQHVVVAASDAALDARVPEMVTRSSVFQPRVAVLLGVPRRWQPVLFASRALACGPAVWWGAPTVLLLVVRTALHLGLLAGELHSQMAQIEWLPDVRLGFTESALAILWCGAAAYLSFFFTDCLMSRWLVNYTPQATIVRLLTINAVNGYLTSWALYLVGGSEDPRLLLPAWISISTALTALYHVTQRKINIRKETSMSISVFSIASFASMVALLVQLYLTRSDYPTIPLATFAQKAWREIERAAVKLVEGREITVADGDKNI